METAEQGYQASDWPQTVDNIMFWEVGVTLGHLESDGLFEGALD